MRFGWWGVCCASWQRREKPNVRGQGVEKMDDVFALIVEVASIVFIISIGIFTAALTVIALSKILSNPHRAERQPEANSTMKFTPDLTPRMWSDETAQRDRELQKWREEHKSRLDE
jgi:hypothetical protein